jgi:L-2,4-diaminobutyric acid acetyltransferase
MKDKKEPNFKIRNTVKTDGPAVYELAKSCPPLDLNSRYCYLLLCSHFNKYCLVAESDKKTIGFVSAYPHPHSTDTLFIWQIGVDPDFHNIGVGTGLLDSLILLAAGNGFSYLETTITHSNKESRALFQKIAGKHAADCKESECFSSDLLGNGHEEERLLRIGPFKLKGDK